MSPADDPRRVRTQTAVVEATAELLLEVGCERLTLDAVAERSGVARSTIYRNWGDRSALIMEAVDCAVSAGLEHDTGTLVGDLNHIGQHLAAALKEGPLGKLMPSLVGAAAFDKALADRLNQLAESRFNHVRIVFERAIVRGEITNHDLDGRVERFISPFFSRSLIYRWALDAAFIAQQVAAAIAEPTDPR